MKTQKTITLNDNYRLKNGVVEYLHNDFDYSADYPYETETCEWRPACKYRVGNRVVLVSMEYIGPNSPGKTNHYLVFDENGVPGNMDTTIKRRHGWRGTTNDVSVTAHGLREIIKISTGRSGRVSVTVGKDLEKY